MTLATEIIADETAGAEEKYWLQEPRTRTLWLFKSVTIKQDHVHGEDWAEKATAQLAGLLGIPSARIELAELHEAPGSISADLRPPLHELQHGQLLLEECAAPGYIHGTGKDHPGHSVENIEAALRGKSPPPGCDLGFDATAYDVLAGYLLLDAWVANRTGMTRTGRCSGLLWHLPSRCVCAVRTTMPAAWGST